MPTEVAQRGVTPCPLMASPDPTPMHRVLNLNDPVLQPDTGCNCNPVGTSFALCPCFVSDHSDDSPAIDIPEGPGGDP